MRFPSISPWMFRAAIPLTVVGPALASATGQLRERSGWHFAAYVAALVVMTTGLVGVLSRYTPLFGRVYMVGSRTEAEFRKSLRLRAFAALGHPFVPVSLVLLTLALTGLRAIVEPEDNGLSTGARVPRETLRVDDAVASGIITGLLVLIVCAACFRGRNKELFPPSRAREWGRRMFKALGHHAGGLLTASVVLCLLATVLTLTGPWEGVWSAVHTVTTVLMFASALGTVTHEASLCERYAGRMRLDAAQYAEARRWRFGLVHMLAPHMRWATGMIVFTWFLDGVADLAMTSLIMVVAGIFGMSMVFHNKYVPWCPQCNDDGGDEAEVPDPSSGKDHPIPA